MASRFTFGGYGGDQVTQDPAGNSGIFKAASNYNAVGTFWSAQSGGTQYTDLVDPNNGFVAITGISTDAHGDIVPFQGPAGIGEGWIDFGRGRFKVIANEGVSAIIAAAGYLSAGGGLVSSKVKTDGTDQTSTVQAEWNSLATFGGGTILYPSGNITCTGKLTVPNSGSAGPTGSTQKALKLKGQGGYYNGQNAVGTGGTRFILTYQGTGSPANVEDAKIVTYGLGVFSLEDLVLQDTTAASSTSFVYSTLTTVKVNNVAVIGATSGTSCAQDAFVFGGTLKYPVFPSSGTGYADPDAPFQGYGTVVTGNYFNNIRRAVYGRSYANQIVVSNNFFDKGCGTNLASGACVVFDGSLTTTHPGDFCTANVITGNYFENVGYVYGIRLIKCANTFVAGNGFEDSGVNFVAGIRLEGTTISSTNYASINNYLIGNFTNGFPLSSMDSMSAAGFNLILGTSGEAEPYQLGPTKFGGTAVHPDIHAYNTFLNTVVSQPVGNGLSTGNLFFRAQRSAGETVNPGGDVFDVYYDGHLAISGGGSGNIAFNNQDGTANCAFQNRGTKWVAIGTSGMTIDVGPTNSWLDIKSYGTRISDQNSGPLRMRIGAGNDGFDLGSASDLTVKRNAQVQLAVNGPIMPTGYGRVVATKTASYSVAVADDVLVFNGASLTATLPDPTLANISGRQFAVKNINASALTVVSAGTSKTIDGAASQSLAQWASGRYVSDGTQWLNV